jgi:hypothetical protein
MFARGLCYTPCIVKCGRVYILIQSLYDSWYKYMRAVWCNSVGPFQTVTLYVITYDQYVFKRSAGAFLERESAFFGILLILVKLTPAMPNLVEFFGEKKEEFVIGITGARENHS